MENIFYISIFCIYWNPFFHTVLSFSLYLQCKVHNMPGLSTVEITYYELGCSEVPVIMNIFSSLSKRNALLQKQQKVLSKSNKSLTAILYILEYRILRRLGKNITLTRFRRTKEEKTN